MKFNNNTITLILLRTICFILFFISIKIIVLSNSGRQLRFIPFQAQKKFMIKGKRYAL